MPASDPVDFARLADWIDGRLPDEEARTVEREVARAGPETQAQVAWLRAFAEARNHVTLDSPPPEVRRRLLAVFEKRTETQAREDQRPSALRRLVASLTFDSGLETATAGVRGPAMRGSRRQLVYTTDVADIVLDVLTSNARVETVDVGGQVLPHDDEEPGSFHVRLLDGASEVVVAATDEIGEFSFGAVPSGTYEILFGTDRVEILMSPVYLRL